MGLAFHDRSAPGLPVSGNRFRKRNGLEKIGLRTRLNLMFNLEKEISEWRRRLADAGIKSRELLDELESHLRDEIAQQMKAGADAQHAFETAVQKIGEPARLKNEFAKAAGGSLLWRLKTWLARLRSHPDEMPALTDFTAEAQQTLSRAREEAPRLHHDFIGTEHLLLGLTKNDAVARLMQRLGIDRAKIPGEIEKWGGLGQPAPRIPANIPFTPRAKRALSLGAQEAHALHHSQISPVHIFLGLLLEDSGVASLVLRSLGVDTVKTRIEIRRELAGS